jgi:maleate cis-trans isomerase/uncharacterized protein YndB with AHSA1/START domain
MARSDTAARTIEAPTDRVYAALIDPEALARWLPPAGMTGRFEWFEGRVGGGYRLVLTYLAGGHGPGKASTDTDVVEARFVEIVPGERVVQAVDFPSDDPAYAGTMTMAWIAEPVPGGTRVTIRADGVPDGISAEDHAVGLASSLANLAGHLGEPEMATGEPDPPATLEISRRYRIGVITPSSNTTVEPVMTAVLSGRPDVTLHFTRIPVTSIRADSSASAQFAAEPLVSAARLLADARVDVVVWAGTSGSWLGLAHDRHLVDILEREIGTVATTSALALHRATSRLGATRLGVAVPYQPDVTALIAQRYQQEGLTCVARACLGLEDNWSFAAVADSEICRLVRSVATPEAQAVAVVCTNFSAAGEVAALERELGIPVLDSVLVTVWDCLQLLGTPGGLDGWGMLLA